MNILFELFLTFAKIGLFTFGGGYAMISMIEHACVDSKQWVSHDDMMNITVIAESTPGPIAINCATFVGYKQKGLVGAIAATLGIVLPSFIVIYLIAMLLDNFLEIAVIANAWGPLRKINELAAYKAKRLKEIEGFGILIINKMKAGRCLEDRSCLSTKEVSSQIFWDKTEDSIRYLFIKEIMNGLGSSVTSCSRML